MGSACGHWQTCPERQTRPGTDYLGGKTMRWSNAPIQTLCKLVVPALCGMALLTVQAQQPQPGLPQPKLFIVTPCGAKAGTSVEMTFAGQDLDEPQALLFSIPGVQAELMAPPPPPPPDKTKTKGKAKAQPTPSLSKFKVTIPANAPLGIHDVRVVNKWGVSNPRAFVVDDLTNVDEKEPNNDVKDAQRV